MAPGTDEVLTALIGAFATLLAAGIAGAVAAGLFLAGEIVKLRGSKNEKQIRAVEDLSAIWADVASVSAPRSNRIWTRRRRYPERVDVSDGIRRLITVLPRRDFVITLQDTLNDELVKARTDRLRITAAATASGALTIWLVNRRRGRRVARVELESRGVRENFDGSAARTAREPRRRI